MPACFKGMCWDDFEETQLVTTVWATSQRGKCLSCPPFRTRSFHQTTTVWESWREIQFLGPNGNRQQQGPWCCDTRGYAVPRRAATCTRVAVRNGSRHPRLQRRTALWLRSWGHLLHVDNTYHFKSSKVLNTIQTAAIKLKWLMTEYNMTRYNILRWAEMMMLSYYHRTAKVNGVPNSLKVVLKQQICCRCQHDGTGIGVNELPMNL